MITDYMMAYKTKSTIAVIDWIFGSAKSGKLLDSIVYNIV
jgi:hypothetical protein